MDGPDHRAVLLDRFARALAAGIEQVIYPQTGALPAGFYQSHPGPRFSLITGGTKHIALNPGSGAADLHVPTRTALFMRPLAWTQPIYDTPREIIGVVFNKDHTRYLWSKHDGRSQPHAPDAWHHAPIIMRGSAAHLLQALCERSHETLGGASGAADAQLLLALIHLAREELARSPIERTGRARATWQSLREYVHEHLHRQISRASTATAFGLHPNYLSTLFVEQGGESFAHFLCRIRMERAAELLRGGTMSVAAVGAACGYPDSGYFIKVFRRHHRTTPGDFRRSH
jgi:AraC-like DNA-binding protein